MNDRIPNRAQKIQRIRRDLKQGYSLSRAAARQGVPYNTALSWMQHGAPPEHRASHDWWIEEAREYERYCVRSIDRALAGFEQRRQQGLERDRRYSPRLTTTGNLPAMWVQPTEV